MVPMSVDEATKTGSELQTTTPAASADAELEALPDDRFADRELSWLRFNERVLELAEDPDLPRPATSGATCCSTAATRSRRCSRRTCGPTRAPRTR